MTIVITGASTGIGAATARELAQGNEIFVHYHSSAEAAEAVAKEIEGSGGTAHLIKADLRSESGCLELVEQIKGTTGKVDALVNNAGGLIRRQPAEEFEWSLMQEIFALNTFSAMLITGKLVPLLRAGQSPSVVFLTSVAARTGAPSATIYGSCKGALDSLTRGLAKELAPEIRVNAVAPGVIETPFHEKVSTPERMKQFAESSVLKRNGKAESIAQAIRFLIENQFTTGETIDVNGGLSMR